MTKKLYRYCLIAIAFAATSQNIFAQTTAWYIDGYHGGIWGHYPDWNTRFMADMLIKNPDWKINIELEPETWDRAEAVDPAALADFKALFADQSTNPRIEYVNPAYAQSYMYNISGESIIRQLSYGMKMIRAHFPTAVFTSYSSEEPCFTSALPQILTSFGFKYASLKNPNTCFGGYTRPHGGELVNWIGPDGTAIIASPRYTGEKLQPKSTWQTIAWNNSPQYVNAAVADGMKHPVGMTLQDAGWKGGPFIGKGVRGEIKSVYTTWRNYFANIAKNDPRQNWKVSQEDILVSLVWGSQVMQQIAQKVRTSENKLVSAEKMAAIAKLYSGFNWPQPALDSAWRTLLLSQHHDCWIVPYNGKPGNTWADKVIGWTAHTNSICDSIVNAAGASVAQTGSGKYITVYNTTAVHRNEVVTVAVPQGWDAAKTGITDADGKEMATWAAGGKLKFKAQVPAVGYAVYQFKPNGTESERKAGINKQADGTYLLETDLYRLRIDPAHGGVIESIVAKKLNNKEFVDRANKRGFNELRGNFYKNGGFKSDKDSSALVEILENDPLSLKIAIKGSIAGSPYTKTISLENGQPRIDINLKIDWKGNPGIGDDTKSRNGKENINYKPFYDDRNKLLALFPLNLKQQKVYKNASFDVTESQLDNTFYTRWDSIKNNVILNWVDVTDGAGKYGMALFTDHTTSYAHGKDFPLALDVQYSGGGLWGRNHAINGPTEIHYALLPHERKWDKAGVWAEGTKFNEPLIISLNDKHPQQNCGSLITVPAGVEVSTVNFDGNNMLIRLFNTRNGGPIKVNFNCKATKAMLTELDGREVAALLLSSSKDACISSTILIPKFGLRTIKLYNVSSK